MKILLKVIFFIDVILLIGIDMENTLVGTVDRDAESLNEELEYCKHLRIY